MLLTSHTNTFLLLISIFGREDQLERARSRSIIFGRPQDVEDPSRSASHLRFCASQCSGGKIPTQGVPDSCSSELCETTAVPDRLCAFAAKRRSGADYRSNRSNRCMSQFVSKMMMVVIVGLESFLPPRSFSLLLRTTPAVLACTEPVSIAHEYATQSTS